MDLRFPFAVLYLLVDIVYVTLSRSFYEGSVQRIQGSGFPTGRLWAGIVAWLALVTGWALLAAPAADRLRAHGWHPLLAGAMTGLVFAFAVYGVYNMTLYVQFRDYTLDVAARDMAWGMGWAAALTAVYSGCTARWN